MSEGRRKGILPLVVVLVGVLILAAGMLMVWRDKARTPVENSQAGETDIPYPLIDRVSPAQAKRALDSSAGQVQ